MRYALAVTPKNYLLFGCHFVNFGAQLTQGYRYLQYHHWGGKEQLLKQKAEKAEGVVVQKAGEVKEGLNSLVNQAKEKVTK